MEMKSFSPVFKILLGVVIFVGFLAVSSELSRSQSEKPEIRSIWNPQKEIFLPSSPLAPSEPLHLGVPEFVAKETPKMIKEEKQEVTPSIPKVQEPAKAREEKAEAKIVKSVTGEIALPKLSPSLLLNHTELQAMVNYLDYEVLPGRGVRFHYRNPLDDHMGHLWFLKRPRDLRGKTIRIDYMGYTPQEMTFKISRSETSAAVMKKVKLEVSPYELQSLFIEIPDRIPFKDVKYFEFWIDRETAGRRHGDFMIEKVVVIETHEKGKQVVDESRPETFPFEHPFVSTNLIRAEVQAR